MRILKAIVATFGVSLCFSYLGCGSGVVPPNISQVLPATISAGSPSLTMKVVGANFTSQAVILWNGSQLPTSMIDSNTLVGTVKSSNLAAPATVQLRVQNTQTGQESQSVPVGVVANATTVSTLTISTTLLPSGVIGMSYSANLTASGGMPAYTWSITSGQLPPGLSLAAATGTISGTPTASGNFSFSATVTDESSPAQTATVTLALVVGTAQTASPLVISLTTLSGGTANQLYSGSLSASGGASPYTWSITSGSLPAGLSVASSGVISGTPTVSGTSNFTVTVKDKSNPVQTQSAPMSIVVAPSALTITSSTLPSSTVGGAYSNTLSASGGTPGYTWSIASGSLPAGLSLASSGVISGTPTASGISKFTATVTDSGNPAQTQSAAVSITVAPSALAIASSSLPSGTVGTAVSTTLSASGGTTPYTWSITSGSLPAGLSLASSGAISGKPTASGTANFTVTVKDKSNPVQTQSASMSIAIAGSAPSTLAITSSTLPSATVGTTYSTTLSASGGTPGYTWSIASGSLPAGLSLASSGAISGTPTASGTSKFTATVTDSGNPAQTQSAAMSITAAPGALTITSSTLPSATVSTSYSTALQASGGTPGYTWSITSGSLPAGLTLAATSGAISGTPTTSGTSNFTATVTDSSNPAQTQSASTSIVVNAAQASGTGNTWYVNGSGGSRYSVNEPNGLCDGTSAAAPVGTTPNQHCAFNDIRYLWTDGSYTTDPSAGAPGWGWIGQGGDTYLIDCPTGNTWCRVGQSGPNSGDYFGLVANPYGAGAPTPPSGTAGQPTQILGLNYASCTSPSAKAQINGGYGVGGVLSLSGASYVNVECIDITDHAQCSRVGASPYPAGCNTSYPLDDYADGGIDTNNQTSNILLQDINIHGLTHYGLFGPIGGPITMNRVRVAYNGFAGWMFDDGNSTPDAPGSSINATNVIMEWNGCNEEYPIVDSIPAISCYDSNSGGFGDAWSAQGTGSGGQTSQMANFVCNQCIIRYNTKDGFGMNHILFDALTITNSQAYGNMGQQWKWSGYDGSNITFTNNETVGNCNRLSAAFSGAPTSYNTYLSNFCRAGGDNIAAGVGNGGTTLIAFNTITGYAATTFDFSCSSNSGGTCATTNLIVSNNILLGYSNPAYNLGKLPGAFYINTGSETITRNNNLLFNQRNDGCPATGFAGELCTDPLLVSEPASPMVGESDLDNFNFNLGTSSPAIGAGVPISGITTDFNGTTRPTPPAIGAVD